MPPPAVVYVAAIITGLAAAIAFKEFIYEPHIAPKLEEWATQFIASRQAKRQAAQNEDTVSTHPMTPAAPSVRTGKTRQTSPGRPANDVRNDTYELETLVAKELEDWRRGVAGASQIRARRTHSASSTTMHSMRESSIGAPGASVLSISSSMTSSIGQLSPNQSQMNHSLDHARRPSTTVSVKSISNTSVRESNHSGTPSVVVVHSVSRAASQADRELMSLPSRPDTPFSAISVPRSPLVPIVVHLPVDHLSADDDMDVFSIQSTVSSDSAEENLRDDGSVWSLASDR